MVLNKALLSDKITIIRALFSRGGIPFEWGKKIKNIISLDFFFILRRFTYSEEGVVFPRIYKQIV